MQMLLFLYNRIYGIAPSSRYFCNMINMKLKHCRIFEIACCCVGISQTIHTIHQNQKKKCVRISCSMNEWKKKIKKNKTTAIEITWGERRRCKNVFLCVLILYSKNPIVFFLLSHSLFLTLPYHLTLLTTWTTYETDPLLILCVKGSEFVSTQDRLFRICTRFSFSFSLCLNVCK